MGERERVVEARRGQAMGRWRLRGERPRGKQREHGGGRQSGPHKRNMMDQAGQRWAYDFWLFRLTSGCRDELHRQRPA